MNTDILKSIIANLKAEVAKLEAELEAHLHPVKTADDPAPPSGGGPGEPPPPPPHGNS